MPLSTAAASPVKTQPPRILDVLERGEQPQVCLRQAARIDRRPLLHGLLEALGAVGRLLAGGRHLGRATLLLAPVAERELLLLGRDDEIDLAGRGDGVVGERDRPVRITVVRHDHLEGDRAALEDRDAVEERAADPRMVEAERREADRPADTALRDARVDGSDGGRDRRVAQRIDLEDVRIDLRARAHAEVRRQVDRGADLDRQRDIVGEGRRGERRQGRRRVLHDGHRFGDGRRCDGRRGIEHERRRAARHRDGRGRLAQEPRERGVGRQHRHRQEKNRSERHRGSHRDLPRLGAPTTRRSRPSSNRGVSHRVPHAPGPRHARWRRRSRRSAWASSPWPPSWHLARRGRAGACSP